MRILNHPAEKWDIFRFVVFGLNQKMKSFDLQSIVMAENSEITELKNAISVVSLAGNKVWGMKGMK